MAPTRRSTPATAPDRYRRPAAVLSGAGVALRWGERGTPLSLFGELSAPRGSLAGDGARGFLAENARLFQLTDLGDLDEQSVVDSPIGTHVTFVQRFEGVRVHGAELKVQFASDGRIIAVNNTSVPGVAVDTHPRIIVHEYGHSVQDNQVPEFGLVEEGRAMGEGFGDYFAATVNAAIAGDFQITCIAEWDATSYAAGVPHCLRRLDSTSTTRATRTARPMTTARCGRRRCSRSALPWGRPGPTS
jgi:fungalysin/thermolysin propeptide